MLREKVCIKTPTGDLTGELFVGADGLPELVLDSQLECESYRPATFPATWTISRRLMDNRTAVLMYAWDRIGQLRDEIQSAQHEAEAEKEVDDIEAYKRDADAEGT